MGKLRTFIDASNEKVRNVPMENRQMFQVSCQVDPLH